MTFHPAPGVARISLNGTWNSVIPLVHVFHVKRSDGSTSPFTSTDLANACSRVIGGFASFLDNMSAAIAYQSAVARDLTAEEGATAQIPLANVGADASASTGPYEGPLIRWRVGTAGRHNGRTFLPGIAEAQVDANGTIAAARVTAMTTRAGQMLTFLNAATDGTHPGAPLRMVVLATELEPPLLELQARQVLSGECRAVIGIQRRRRP